jgi:hypothetical protein
MGDPMIRYFVAPLDVYEHVRRVLDEAWGYPNSVTLTITAVTPGDRLPMDSEGRVYLDISSEYCQFILPSEMLPVLLQSGSVTEITEAEYRAALQQQPA